MAISKGANSSNTATTGTTCLAPSGTGTINVNAGDYVIVAVSLIPTSATVTWSKSGGTATIGSFATNIVQTNGNAHLVVSWCKVTGTGTLRIQMSSSATITNAVVCIQVYAGSVGPSQSTVGSGSSGTSETLSLKTQFSNDWVLLIGNTVSATALTAGSGMAASPVVSSSNISGTANDLTCGIGSNESALSDGTTQSVTFTQANNATYSTIALELVLAFTINCASPTALATSTFAPKTVIGTRLVPATKALSLSTFAPSAIVERRVTPTTKSLTTSAFAPTIVTSSQLFAGCVAAYKLEDLTDATGRGNSLTNNNTATFNTGKIGNAVYLTGGQFLSRASNADVQAGDVDFTIAAWVYLSDKTSNRGIVCKWASGSGQPEYAILYGSAADRFRFLVYTPTDNQVEVQANNFGSPSTGTWYCVIAWHDATANTINISINNGSVDSLGTGGSLQTPGTADFYIGVLEGAGPTYPMEGRIDNVNIWKRVISSQERSDFYNGGAGVEFVAPTGNVIARPSTASLTTTAYAPKLANFITPGTKVLSLTTFAPAARVGKNVQPSTASLTITAFAPDVIATTTTQVTFLEAGGASTGGGHLFDSVTTGNGVAADTSFKPLGAYSALKLTFTSSPVILTATNILGTANRYSFYFAQDQLPTFLTSICQIRASNDQNVGTLSSNTAGRLVWEDGVGGTVTGTTVLSNSHFYRLSLAFNFNGTSNNLSVKVYIDGSIELNLTGKSTAGITSADRIRWINNDNGGSTRNVWLAHQYIDDGTDLADLGDIRCNAKFPTTANADNFDTTGGTGAVNERPLSTTNYREQAGSSQVSQNYNLESAGAGDIDITGAPIVGYMGWIRAKQSAVSGTPKITVNGSDYAITLTTSPATYRKTITTSSYPSNSAAIGMVSGGTADDTFLYECGMVVAFTPNNITVTPSTVTLSTSTFAPKLALAVIPTTKSLSTNTFAPTIVRPITVSPSTAMLSTSRFAPVLAVAAIPSARSLSLSTFAPSVVSGTLVKPGSASFTISTFAPLNKFAFVPTAQSLTLNTFAPDAVVESHSVTVTPSTASLTLSEFAPSLGFAFVPTTKNPSLASFFPTVVTPVTTTPTTQSLTTSTFAPGLSLAVKPTTRSLSVATFAPAIVRPVTAGPSTTTLSLSQFAPSVGYGVVPTTKSLSTSTFAPVLKTAVIPQTAALTLTKFPPVMEGNATMFPISQSLTITGYVPTLSLSVRPTTKALSTSTFAPKSFLQASVSPTTASLSLTAYRPVLAARVDPNTASLTIVTSSPSIRYGIVPATRALTTARFAPIVARAIIPAARHVSLTTLAPRTGYGFVPTSQALTIQGFAPSLSFTVRPSTKSLLLSGYEPALTGLTNVLEPSTASLIITSQNPLTIAFAPRLGINIDAENRTIGVDQESRRLRVAAENSQEQISRETRAVKIDRENRVH